MDNDKHERIYNIYPPMAQGGRRRQVAHSKTTVDLGIYHLGWHWTTDKETLIGVEWKWDGEHDKNNKIIYLSLFLYISTYISSFEGCVYMLYIYIYKSRSFGHPKNQFVSYQPLHTHHFFSVHGMMSRKVTIRNVAYSPLSIAIVSFHPLATLSFAVLIFCHWVKHSTSCLCGVFRVTSFIDDFLG